MFNGIRIMKNIVNIMVWSHKLPCNMMWVYKWPIGWSLNPLDAIIHTKMYQMLKFQIFKRNMSIIWNKKNIQTLDNKNVNFWSVKWTNQKKPKKNINPKVWNCRVFLRTQHVVPHKRTPILCLLKYCQINKLSFVNLLSLSIKLPYVKWLYIIITLGHVGTL